MTSSPSSPPASGAPEGAACADAVILRPRAWVPLGLLALAGAGLGLRPLWSAALWPALAMGVMGLFLLLQTALLRLRFAADALLVSRGDSVIRRFPYDEWIAWRVWWPALPVLFYFRERKSIHLLPMLFDATALREELERRLPAPSPPESAPPEPGSP
ncbi:DUF3119 family protein [Cyanobium gracile UHCC 0139]|uniref:DUF3119 family protein n=1 Tax=Cyanobium gracile UHCC 0139 TaxID=3110308 RepID=A0ABU5RST5_9CYAN|nr:DUF3119 family protein [Cyanobium gracile]MEA5390854.1 DUF3119 family protein [Cyanobium gracile UHCC 0139]